MKLDPHRVIDGLDESATPETPRESWLREQALLRDGGDLSFVLGALRNVVEPDSELADLHRQAVRAVASGLPFSYLAVVVSTFCERWLTLADQRHPACLMVVTLTRQLRNSQAPSREAVHAAAEVVRPRLFSLRAPHVSAPPVRTGRRVPSRREQRTRRARSVRSGTSRDGPSRSDDDDPHDADLARARGRLGVLDERARR